MLFGLSVNNKQLRVFALGCLVFLTSLLSACGFQMRGSYHMPAYLKNICFQSASAGPLSKQVKQRLELSGVSLTDSKATCSELTLIRDHLDRRTLSVFPNGQVAEYELIYSVEYAIFTPQMRDSGEAERQFKFEIFRDYQDNPDAVLAKSREMKLILAEMRVQAADRIVRQLASLSL